MVEADAEEAAQNDEKVYEDDEMWTKGCGRRKQSGNRLCLNWG
jgi:hypothetical protein